MSFPNYNAIEAVSSINISSQALQQQAVSFFSQVTEKNNQLMEQQHEIIRSQAEKIKKSADVILEALNTELNNK